MSKISTFLLFLYLLSAILLFACTCPNFVVKASSTSNGSGQDYLGNNEVFKVPMPEFVGSLQSTIGVIREVISSISNIVGDFWGDFRLSNATLDCFDLLDSTVDNLSWSLYATQSPKGTKSNSTGNLSSDIRTWLSAALVNQDTCIEGFEDTNGIFKDIVSNSLTPVTSLVQQLLQQVEPVGPEPTHFKPGKRNVKNGHFPWWFSGEDRKLLQGYNVRHDVVVARDGTGDYTRITDAIDGAPSYSMSRYVIYVKRGVYKEYVVIEKKKWNIMLVGDGMNVTVITGHHSKMDGWTTFRSATVVVSGRGFIARNITFENTAGPDKGQAVALRSDSDLSVYYNCEFTGYQDTLYTHAMRQFYRECRISGTVDFIFGDASVVFQNCQILARHGLPKQQNTITAHGRKYPSEPTGYSFQFCNISADTDLLPYMNMTSTYLGRPWKNYSRTVFMQSYMSDMVRPEGWLPWDGRNYLDTLYYGEYLNYGPRSRVEKRVNWTGYHVLNDSKLASKFTVAQFIEGDLWLPSTGVEYNAGLEVY